MCLKNLMFLSKTKETFEIGSWYFFLNTTNTILCVYTVWPHLYPIWRHTNDSSVQHLEFVIRISINTN